MFTESIANCPIGKTNHAVNLVGYGTSSSGKDYYILRNQWGTSWGIQGYMYFARDSIGNANQCEIASFASYPIVKSSNSLNSLATKSSSWASNSTLHMLKLNNTTTSYSNKCISCQTVFLNNCSCEKKILKLFYIILFVLVISF